MTSSEYVKVNKKNYIKRIIELEAENKALSKKIKLFEDMLNTKINKSHNCSKNNYEHVDKKLNKQNNKQDNKQINIEKKTDYELIAQYLTHDTSQIIDKTDIEMFLKHF